MTVLRESDRVAVLRERGGGVVWGVVNEYQ